jgi:hypothetical protein
MGIKQAFQTLGAKTKALLVFVVAVVPPVIALLNVRSTDLFLYGAAVLGGILAFSVKMLDEEEF